MADETRRHGVEHPPQEEAARGGHANADRLEVLSAGARQRVEHRALDIDARAAPGVSPPDDFVDESAVLLEDVEVVRAAQQQSVGKGALEMAVRTFHGAVLMRFAPVVAGGRHGVVRAQRRVACRGIFALVPLKVAVGRREAVAAVLARRAPYAPQRVLQPFGQRGEALPPSTTCAWEKPE